MVKVFLTIAFCVSVLTGLVICLDEEVPASMSMANERVLDALRQKEEMPQELLSVLKEWNVVPSWAVGRLNLRVDWLRTLHENVTREAWPIELKEAVAGTVAARSLGLAFSTTGSHRVIGIFDATPAYLSQLLELVNHPLVLPESADPSAKMSFNASRGSEAVRRLAQLLGMLKETSYLDGPEKVWRPAVILGTRFIYYHELGHLVLKLDASPVWRFDVQSSESEFAEELNADRFAFSMLTLETGSNPRAQVSAMVGIVFAMGLIASQEFVNEKSFASIKGSVLRMKRLFHWGRLAASMGKLSPEALTVSTHYWRLFELLLRKIDNVPSPVSALLRHTADRPKSAWKLARNRVVKWCAFGECRRVTAALREVCISAKRRIDSQKAKMTLQVIDYILGETARLEPQLGLARPLQDEACSTLP